MIEEYRLPDGRTVKETLLAMQADSNKEFAARLNPGIENVLGLRIPQLRKLAKIIARHQCEQYLSAPGDFYMEERMLHGMVLGEIDMDDIDGYLQRVAVFVRSINSWSVCDTFDFKGKRRLVERYPSLIRQWLLQWLDSDREYEVRFAVVMFMKYFIGQGNPSEVALVADYREYKPEVHAGEQEVAQAHADNQGNRVLHEIPQQLLPFSGMCGVGCGHYANCMSGFPRCKDTYKSRAKPNLFGLCRAGVSKTKSKIIKNRCLSP